MPKRKLAAVDADAVPLPDDSFLDFSNLHVGADEEPPAEEAASGGRGRGRGRGKGGRGSAKAKAAGPGSGRAKHGRGQVDY